MDFRVCRRGRRNAPLSYWAGPWGICWSWMVSLKRSMSFPHPSELQEPRSTLPTGGELGTQRLAECSGLGLVGRLPSCVQGLPRLNSHMGEGSFSTAAFGMVCPPGWWSLRASYWRAPRLPTGWGWPGQLCCRACLRYSTLVPSASPRGEGGRGGLVGDGGRCRDTVDCPHGGIGNFLSGKSVSRGERGVQ